MAISLSPARTARLFHDIEVQQQALLHALRPALLPQCPDCRRRPRTIVLAADGDRISFDRCGHRFALSPAALIAGLRAQRTL